MPVQNANLPEIEAMKKLIALCSAVLLASCGSMESSTPAAAPAAAASASGVLKSTKYLEINAAPAKVWSIVKDFDGLHKWHPAFSNDVLTKGSNGQVGAVRAITLKDGPTFTESLLAYSDESMSYKYDILESPLPLDNYLSEMRVSPRGHVTMVTWTGSYKRKAGAKETDADVKNLIDGAYEAGLRNVRNMAEAN
jgi:hypothetical protein